jgi:hypothetical protein
MQAARLRGTHVFPDRRVGPLPRNAAESEFLHRAEVTRNAGSTFFGRWQLALTGREVNNSTGFVERVVRGASGSLQIDLVLELSCRVLRDFTCLVPL